MVLVSSCGTIVDAISKGENKGQRQVYLMNCPDDVVITFAGVTYPVSTADYMKNAYVKIKMPAVFLPYKANGTLTLSSAAMGKSNTIDMKSSLWGPTTCLNCIFLPGVGNAIDYVTKNDRILKPRLIDVTAFLNGQPKNLWQQP